MTLIFEDESGIDLGFDKKEAAEKAIETSLGVIGLTVPAEINLTVTTPEEIRIMNRGARGIDAETDVLSFPLQEFETEGDFGPLLEKGGVDVFNPETGELMLGDIVINASRVVSQAQEYGHSNLREYSFLIAHSVLHLSGYDHMDAADEKRMIDMQKRIMLRVGISRDD